MRKKMKLFIAMVSVGALLGTMPVMAAEQPELPTKVQDIANGSDELYGEGVPIEHAFYFGLEEKRYLLEICK